MRSVFAVVTLAAVLACVPCAGAGQASCKGMPGMDAAAGATPPEKLPPPVAMTGIGNGTIAITTSSAEAQMWFTQGLNLLRKLGRYVEYGVVAALTPDFYPRGHHGKRGMDVGLVRHQEIPILGQSHVRICSTEPVTSS